MVRPFLAAVSRRTGRIRQPPPQFRNLALAFVKEPVGAPPPAREAGGPAQQVRYRQAQEEQEVDD